MCLRGFESSQQQKPIHEHTFSQKGLLPRRAAAAAACGRELPTAWGSLWDPAAAPDSDLLCKQKSMLPTPQHPYQQLWDCCESTETLPRMGPTEVLDGSDMCRMIGMNHSGASNLNLVACCTRLLSNLRL